MKRTLPVFALPAIAAVLLTLSGAHTLFAQSFLPRNYYAAKLEPLSTVLHGAGQCYWDNGAVEYRQALRGLYDPAVINDYFNVGVADSETDNIIGNLIKSWLGKFPNFTALQIGLNMKGLAEEVANGSYDNNINYFFTALNGLGRPVYLRIGYECNGSWNSYSPQRYKDAFIRVTNLLRKHALGNKAATIWSIAAGGRSDYMSWYPGDQYVDWWSIDVFRPAEIKSSTTQRYLADAASCGKPVMIGESTPRGIGVLSGQTSWDAWFKPYFDLIHANPGIKAFSYINWNWDQHAEYAGWGDCRIGQNAIVTGLYAQEMNSTQYLHASTSQGFYDSVTPISHTTPLAPKHLVLK